MTTLSGPTIHNLAIEGNFDDCQSMLQATFGDLDINKRYALGAVNTVIPTVKDGQRWNVGDNTDWIGVSVAVSAALARQPPTARRRALLVGSGGTARAASGS